MGNNYLKEYVEIIFTFDIICRVSLA